MTCCCGISCSRFHPILSPLKIILEMIFWTNLMLDLICTWLEKTRRFCRQVNKKICSCFWTASTCVQRSSLGWCSRLTYMETMDSHRSSLAVSELQLSAATPLWLFTEWQSLLSWIEFNCLRSTAVGKAARLSIYWLDAACRLVIPLRQVTLAQLNLYHHQSGKLVWNQYKDSMRTLLENWEPLNLDLAPWVAIQLHTFIRSQQLEQVCKKRRPDKMMDPSSWLLRCQSVDK